MSTTYTQFKDESSDDDFDPPSYSSEKVVMKQPGPILEPMGKVIRPKAGWTICCAAFTMCCCFSPLGVAALVFAVISTSHDDYEVSKRQLRLARIFNWVSLILGVILIICITVVYYGLFTQLHQAQLQQQQQMLQQAQQQQQQLAAMMANQDQALPDSAAYATAPAP